MLKKEQIDEWSENPVTLELKALIKREIGQLRLSKADAYHPYQAERTQEILANLNGAEDTWELVEAALDGDWVFFEVDDEPIRDNSEG
jgi:hypothetical protein